MFKQKLNRFTGATLSYFLLMIGFILIRLSSHFGLLSFLGPAGNYVLSLILQVGLMFLLPIFLYSYLIKEKPKNTLKIFGVKKIKPKAVLISFILGAVVFVLNIGVATFFSYILLLLGYEKGTSVPTAEIYTISTLLINLIFTAVLPAICEEVAHRGMLVDGFSKLGYKKAIIFSAILFGLTHLNIEQFFYASIIGALLGFITMSTGNLWPAIIIHFMNNALNVFVDFFYKTSVVFKNAYNNLFLSLSRGSFFASVATLFLIITLLMLLLAYLVMKLFKETTVQELGELAQEEAKKHLRAELMDEKFISVPKHPMDIPFKVTRDGKTFQVFVSSTTLRHPIKQTFFPKLSQQAFFISSFITAGFITIATFIWGIL